MRMKFLFVQGELAPEILSSELLSLQWFVKLIAAYITFAALIPLVLFTETLRRGWHKGITVVISKKD